MHREIKFRGKRIVNGKWVYGYLTKIWGQFNIVEISDGNIAYEVDTETVGQYTGRKDKNEVEIYGEDIVKIQHGYYPSLIGRVSFEEGQWMVKELDGTVWNLYSFILAPVEVIGNIQDNLELLEESNG